jgi:anti-sigma B factor antagonist
MPTSARLRRAETLMTTDPESFSLSRSTHGKVEVVTFAGELDMAHASTVAETLDALADTERPLIVDLSDLTFIDSSGIHAILRPRPQQGLVILVCPPGNIQRVLSVTKIDRVLPVYETLDEAVASAE